MLIVRLGFTSVGTGADVVEVVDAPIVPGVDVLVLEVVGVLVVDDVVLDVVVEVGAATTLTFA
jgi:hypothetical protein